MIRLLFHRHKPDEPCPHMTGLLHDAAQGRIKGFRRWYALAHAAQCGPCRRFLESLETMLLKLQQAKEDPAEEVISRLKSGRWQEAAPEVGAEPEQKP